MLITLNGLLTGSGSQYLVQLVLFINMAHFFHELARAELAHDIENDALKLFTFFNHL